MENQRAVEKQMDDEVPRVVFDFPGQRDGDSIEPAPSAADANRT
jgi:hypothetical protein